MAKRRVSLTLEESLVNRLDDRADREGNNRSETVSTMLREQLGERQVSEAVVFCGDERCLSRHGDQQILSMTLRNLEENDVDSAYLLSGMDRLDDQLEYQGGIQLEIVGDEGEGTGSALELLRDRIDTVFAALNGHVYAGVDLKEMRKFHSEQEGAVTMALRPTNEPSSYGVADLKGNRIQGFVHQPQPGEEPSHLINAGFYVMSPRVFGEIGSSDLDAVFERLASEDKLSGYVYGGDWFEA
nr:MAG: nucleoside-diphosphate-sugar pyrophosphorylase [Candidatus Nanosalinarum sp. J07AB56]